MFPSFPSQPPIARSMGYIASNLNNPNVFNIPNNYNGNTASVASATTVPAFANNAQPPSIVPLQPPIAHSVGHYVPHVPLPSTPITDFDDLRPGEMYHVWTRTPTGNYQHEGYGKFVQRQGVGYADALFEPFTIPSGAVLESQVFNAMTAYFYKLSNVKGGRRSRRRLNRRKNRGSRRH